jgi:hypothetical protein
MFDGRSLGTTTEIYVLALLSEALGVVERKIKFEG